MNASLEQIKPETIALIESQAEASGLSIDEYLRRLLPGHEKQLAVKAGLTSNGQSQSGVKSPKELQADRQKSIAWIRSHREDYGGLYVALDGDVLIASGKVYGDVVKTAREKGFKNAFVGDVLTPDYEGFLGGWD